jgi:hypothetical protein
MAESGRRYDAGLQNEQEIARIGGRAQRGVARFNMQGTIGAAQQTAAGGVAQAMLNPGPRGPDPIRVAGNRVVDTRTGAEIAPEQRRAASVADGPQPGTYLITQPDGTARVEDLRQKPVGMSMEEYMAISKLDPESQKQYLMQRMQRQQGAPGAPTEDGTRKTEGPAGGAGGGLPTMTPEQARAAAPGTRYVGTDGRIRTR